MPEDTQPAKPDAGKPAVKIKKPPILFARTQEVLRALEGAVGGPVIAYWNSYNGEVCHNDVRGIYELLRGTPAIDTLHVFIKSDGGSGTASLRIVHLLRRFAKRLVALVPLDCMSAATMVALGADEIRMGPIARLSAVDTSLRHELSPLDRDNRRVAVSQNEVERILDAWRKFEGGDAQHPFPALFSHVHPLVIGAVDRASSLSIRLCREILSYHMKDEKLVERISNTLNSDYPAHSYPITLDEARRTGLNCTELDERVNELLLELNGFYSEMGQQAITDYDERNYHDNEILNILERPNLQVFFQSDKDWHYRETERRWIPMNDESSWRRMERKGSRVTETRLHMR
jgi:hypothetical protein